MILVINIILCPYCPVPIFPVKNGIIPVIN